MKFPIRIKLLASFGLILLLSSGLVLFTYVLTDQYIRSQHISLLQDKAENASASLQSYFSDIEESYNNLALQYQKNASGVDFTILAMHEVADQHTEQLTVLSPTGRELQKFDATGAVPASKLSVELATDALTKALKGDTSTSKVYFDDQQKPHLDIFLPITSAQGQVTAILKGQISLENIQGIVTNLNLGPDGIAYIIDDEGQLISHPRASKISDTSQILQRPLIQHFLHNASATINPNDDYYTNEQGVPVVAASHNVSALGWVVVVEQPVSQAFSQLYFIQYMLLGSLALVVIVLLILALVLSNHLAQPIARLRRGTEALQQGESSTQVEIHTGDELESLAQSFNLMADKLRQREVSLQQSNHILAVERDRQITLLQSLTDGVFATDQEGKILLFNRSAEAITGLQAEMVMGKSIDEVMPLFDATEAWPMQRFSDQSEEVKTKLQEQGLIFHQPGGGVLPLSLTVAPVTLSQDVTPGWIATFHDVTQEHELESMKLDFVSMAAHELRTPLTALRGYLSLVLDETADKLSDEIKMFLERSLISANQLSALVENLLNVSRIERGVLKIALAPLQLEDLIDGSMMNLEEVAKQKQITVTFENPKKTLPLVMADQFRIGEVITNLVANGINYTPSGGKVTVSLQLEKNRIVTKVSDTGEGIPASAISHLFTKFYRVQASLAQGSKGTGLGLFISKAIIDAHHGDIWVESVEGQGSDFYFSLPLAPEGSKAPVLGKA